MSSPTTTTLRIRDLRVHFERIGPEPSRRSRKPAQVIGDLVLRIPPHTARNAAAMAAFLDGPVQMLVRRHMPVDDYTVTIELDGLGVGRVLVDGGRNGTGRIERAA